MIGLQELMTASLWTVVIVTLAMIANELALAIFR